MSDDIIYRYDAIDALAFFTEKSPTGRTAQEVVKALPSVQSATKCIAEIKFSKEDLEELVDKKIAEIKATQERRIGKWIWVETEDCVGWNCSECGYDISQRYGRCNFCPNCGARMNRGDAYANT